VVETIDWFPLVEYMNSLPDLLEFGTKKANYPFNMSWESGAFPGGAHNVNNDNELAATTEIIFARIACAIGFLMSSRGHITA